MVHGRAIFFFIFILSVLLFLRFGVLSFRVDRPHRGLYLKLPRESQFYLLRICFVLIFFVRRDAENVHYIWIPVKSSLNPDDAFIKHSAFIKLLK